MLGDLFDTETVSNRVLLFTIEAYTKAAEKHFSTIFIIMEGNHDAGAVQTKTTSFDVLKASLAHISNIYVIANDKVRVVDDVTYFGWSRNGYDPKVTTPIVVGHWDVVDFGNNHNIVPEFDESVKVIVTGHDHVRRTVGRIEVVGSMQPYSHSQDRAGEFYVTLTLEDYATYDQDLSNKCVRFLLREGETAPTDLDCLQKSWFFEGHEFEEESEGDLDVQFDFDFNVKTALKQQLESAGVSSKTQSEVLAVFSEAMLNDE